MGNASGNGFWRTHHDGELMDNLLAHLGELEPIERYLVVDDTWADLLAGRVEVSRVVEVCEAMTDDRHPAVWRRLGGVFGGLRRLIANDHLDQFQAWVRSVSFVALEDAARLAHDGDAAAQDLYAVLFGIAGVTGADPATQQAARELLAADPAKVDANLLASATGVVAADAPAAEHRDLMARWRAADNPQEEVRFLYALVDTPSREDFEATLDLVTNEVRTQNAPYVLMRALSHPTLGAIAWRYLIDRWGDITERFPTNALPRMIEGIRWLTDDAVADPDAERGAPQFLARHPLGSGDQLVQQSLELQAVHRALVERSRPSLGGLIAQRPRRCLSGAPLADPSGCRHGVVSERGIGGEAEGPHRGTRSAAGAGPDRAEAWAAGLRRRGHDRPADLVGHAAPVRSGPRRCAAL